MKHYKKTITMLLTAAVLLVSVFMAGCTSLTEPKNSTPSGTDALTESDGFGVYVKLERDDASSIALHGSSFTKLCENADGVTCSTSDAADAPADVPPVLTLPILDEIDRNVTIGTADSSLLAVQEAGLRG